MSGLSSANMHEIGEAFNKKMKQRINSAKTIDDIDAPPLTEKYKERKAKVTPFLTRNLWYSGDMQRTMDVVRIDQNSFTIFFTATPVMSRRMAFNQRRSPMWGVSPSDKVFLKNLFDEKLRVKLERGQSKEISAA